MENVAGELTKSDLKKVLAGAGVKESGEMDFTTFKKVMLDLEDVLNDGEDDEEDDDSETVLFASPVQSAGKGFARSEVGSNMAPASSSGQGEEEDYSDEDEEELTDEEEEAIAQEIFDELKSKSGKVSVKNLMAYETVADLLKCKRENYSIACLSYHFYE